MICCCNYSVSKRLKIPSDCLWITLVISFLAALLAIALFTFLTTNDYRDYEKGLSAVTIDLNGITMDDSNREIWDASDVLVPVEEGGAFFVTTNFRMTKGQQRGTCPESGKVRNADCQSNTDPKCAQGNTFPEWHGVAAGTCSLTATTCNIHAWCPVQGTVAAAPKTEETFLNGTKNFVLSITNRIYFLEMKRAFSNLNSSTKQCRHSKASEEGQLCANFVLGDVVEWALENSGQGDKSYNDLVRGGAIISIRIFWDCYNLRELCEPKYEFKRLDTKNENIDVTGYDLEYSHKYYDGSGKRNRDHIHSYGILFKIQVDADGYNYSHSKTFRIVITALIAAAGMKTLLDICINCCNPEVKEQGEDLKRGCHCCC